MTVQEFIAAAEARYDQILAECTGRGPKCLKPVRPHRGGVTDYVWRRARFFSGQDNHSHITSLMHLQTATDEYEMTVKIYMHPGKSYNAADPTSGAKDICDALDQIALRVLYDLRIEDVSMQCSWRGIF